MSDTAVVFLLIPVLYLSILVCVGLGRRLDMQRVLVETERERIILTTIETCIYALLGLMVAFTFAGAASRFDARRTLTVNEANAIGDAYARLDLLPAQVQPALRVKMHDYASERLAVYQSLPDLEASNRHAARANVLQSEIWKGSVSSLDGASAPASMLLLPSLNDMSGIAATRSVMLKAHTPLSVIGTLVALTMICAVLIGNGFPRTGRAAPALHVHGFALVLSVTLYVIFDLDHPRVGLIRLDYADAAMVELIDSMQPAAAAAQAP